MDFNVYDNKADFPMYRPKTPSETSENQWTNSDSESAIESLPNTLIIDVENLDGCGNFNSFHTSDDEQNSDNTLVHSVGGKRGSAFETLIVSRKNEDASFSPENDSIVVCNSKSESEFIDRTRTAQAFQEEIKMFNEGEGCVSSSFRDPKNCKFRFDGSKRVFGQRSFYDRKKIENPSYNVISESSRSGKNIFRRNYRIGGFRNIGRLRKEKGSSGKNKESSSDVFSTSEISLAELFADSSVNLLPETELENNDDSFAILEKLGLDDDFIKKEPEISLDVESAVEKADSLIKTETGQNCSDSQSSSFQKQRLKIDKNIFEFSETDFLKYETDCDVDDLLPDLVQNDVVGCCGLFGLTPNSRFNLVSPTYLPLEIDKSETDQLEEVMDGVDDKLDSGESVRKAISPSPSNYGQIADISSDIENHEVTLQLKMNGNLENNSSENVLTSRLNEKNDFPDGYQLGNGDQAKVQPSQLPINYVFALNHHNYTISGPPGYSFKQNSSENTQSYENQVDIEVQGTPTTVSSGSSTSVSLQTNSGNAWKPTLYKAGVITSILYSCF